MSHVWVEETCSWFLLLCDSHLVTIRVLELKKLYA